MYRWLTEEAYQPSMIIICSNLENHPDEMTMFSLRSIKMKSSLNMCLHCRRGLWAFEVALMIIEHLSKTTVTSSF
jgi:hypothetical protein